MNNSSHVISFVFDNLNINYIFFAVMNEVTVTTDVVAYNGFNLVVDLGSALGLWLGVSALSMYDLATDIFIKTKNYMK